MNWHPRALVRKIQPRVPARKTEPRIGAQISILRGIGLKIASTLAFSIMAALVKLVGTHYPIGEIVFCRSFFGLLPILFLVWQGGGIVLLRTTRPVAHLTRSASGAISMMCNFAALALLPLADVTVLTFLAPMLTTAIASVALGERVGPYRWSALLIGFSGVMLASLPHLNLDAHSALNVLSPGAGFALGSATFAAFAMISIRRLAATETGLATAFYFMVACAAGSGFSLFFTFRLPSTTDAMILIGTGIAGGFGQVLMTNSYRHASIATLAPFDYVAIIWAIVLGYMLFDQLPESMVLAGAAVVVLAGFFMLYRERRLQRNPEKCEAVFRPNCAPIKRL